MSIKGEIYVDFFRIKGEIYVDFWKKKEFVFVFPFFNFADTKKSFYS